MKSHIAGECELEEFRLGDILKERGGNNIDCLLVNDGIITQSEKNPLYFNIEQQCRDTGYQMDISLSNNEIKAIYEYMKGKD